MESKSTWKRVGLGAVSLASVALLAACGGDNKSAANKNEINWYTPTEILSLDSSKHTDQYSALAIGNSSSNLLRVDKKGEPKPDLAKSVEMSENGLTYTATLRDGLKWSDGSALTAEDFVYTWQRMVDPKTASEYSYLAVESHLENADKINSGELSDLNQLGVKADGNKVIFTLTSPCPQFKYYLAFSNFMPQKKSFVEKEGDKYATTSKDQIYSGPYTVKGWNGSDGSFKLVKNKYYWNAKNVKTDKVNLQAIKKADTAVQMYKNGAKVSDESKQLAQEELNTLSTINAENQGTDGYDADKLNVALADIKSAVADAGSNVTKDDVRKIVDETLDNYKLKDVLSNNQINMIVNFAFNLSKSSIIDSSSFKSALASLKDSIVSNAGSSFKGINLNFDSSSALESGKGFLTNIWQAIVNFFKNLF
jgi:ABC-type oligopeptide transport system substrate-binding subunit